MITSNIKKNKTKQLKNKRNLITSTQRRVPNNTKIHQPKTRDTRKIFLKSNKNEEKNEREKQPFVCEKKYKQNEKESCKFTIRGVD